MKRIWAMGFAAVFALLTAGAAAPARRARPLTLVVMSEAVAETDLAGRLEGSHTWQSDQWQAVFGDVGHRRVALATGGLQTEHARAAAQTLIRDLRPREVICVGEAGALVDGLQVGDIVVGRRTVFHPYGFVTPEGKLPESWQPPHAFPALPWLVTAAEEAVHEADIEAPERARRGPHVAVVDIATVGGFISAADVRRRVNEESGALAAQMGAGFVTEACAREGIPFVDIRAISDDAGPEAMEQYRQNRSLAAANAAAVVGRLLPELEGLERVIPEGRERNYLPDIRVHAELGVGADPARGTFVFAAVTNEGPVWAPRFEVIITVEPGEETEGTLQVHRYRVGPLRPGERRELMSGPYELGKQEQMVTATADPDDRVAEYDEENNVQSRPFTKPERPPG
ncbi:MAG: CARDB domain-containing protein [Candidatus Brocadiia bacterium]